MSERHLIVLGTASQAPTRYRHHNSYALRWDDQLVLFDPGEGTQRQCILAGVAIARADAVCVTHFHGDHSLGLPGVIQRRALDNRSSEAGLGPLPVVFPAEGRDYFERLRHATAFYDTSEVEPVPVLTDESSADRGSVEGLVGGLVDGRAPEAILSLGRAAGGGPALVLSARRLDHRIPTIGYRLDEPDGTRIDAEAAAARGITGPAVGRLLRDGRLTTAAGTVGLEEVSSVRRGQSMAFVMDTRPCAGAEELAAEVDLLVCESTFLHHDVELAQRYHHLTARQAAELARRAGARRLVLSHFSARYPDAEVLGDEARAIHDDVVVADDLLVVPVPERSRDG